MKTIDLSTQIVLLDGTLPKHINPATRELEEAPPESYGQAIANYVLARSTKGPAMKFMSWANTLQANKPISLDKTDFELFRKTVEETEVLFNFVKAFVLEVCIDAIDV